MKWYGFYWYYVFVAVTIIVLALVIKFNFYSRLILKKSETLIFIVRGKPLIY